ncbi:MAG: hypothetical protein LBC78_04130 [Oscillospiraceae bacterium]|jgi:hypothetical protein|nr:hypothetical protein [Oscillospiraceae bacterium]
MSITGDSVFKISRWLGLNENPDGETELKAGEAAEMRNFRITDSGGLQLRPGYRAIAEKAWDGPVRGVWNGMVGERETTVFAAGGSLWELDVKSGAATPILPESETIADDDTRFFGFGGSVYIQNGDGYYVWDGVSAVASVEGYRPLVAVACQPGGGGTALERVNKLNGRRRVRFSPTGSANVFQLPEKSLQSVDFVRNRITNTEYAAADYSINLTNGTVMFASAPAAGTDTIEIGYTYPETMRCEVERMRFAEIFNGSSDNRVFLYGDGTNRTLYSGLDYDGTPRADYFPDLNVLDIGTSNTPITAMIRHYSLLAVFKTDGAFSVAYGTITLAGGAVTAAFYWTPANRSIGNTPPGQAQLVLNAPLTLCDGAALRRARSETIFHPGASQADVVHPQKTRAPHTQTSEGIGEAPGDYRGGIRQPPLVSAMPTRLPETTALPSQTGIGAGAL